MTNSGFPLHFAPFRLIPILNVEAIISNYLYKYVYISDGVKNPRETIELT